MTQLQRRGPAWGESARGPCPLPTLSWSSPSVCKVGSVSGHPQTFQVRILGVSPIIPLGTHPQHGPSHPGGVLRAGSRAGLFTSATNSLWKWLCPSGPQFLVWNCRLSRLVPYLGAVGRQVSWDPRPRLGPDEHTRYIVLVRLVIDGISPPGPLGTSGAFRHLAASSAFRTGFIRA